MAIVGKVAPGSPQWYQIIAKMCDDIMDKNKVLKVGHFEIKWCNARDHLAYKRFEALHYHPRRRCKLRDLATYDLKQDKHLHINNNDELYIKLVHRILNDSKQYLRFEKCAGCGEAGAPTTDNLPVAWHMKCWLLSLGYHPQASMGYTKHFSDQLGPKIMRMFPKLQTCEFRELFETMTDIFYIQLYDINTKGKHTRKRFNDKDKTYSGICSFNLEKLQKDSKYFHYVIDLMVRKHEWYDIGICYSNISYDSFVKNSQFKSKRQAIANCSYQKR